MMRSLFTAGSGMRAQQFNVDTISNNLSNVNTTGFKRDRADFQDTFYEHLQTPGAPANEATEHPTGISVGSGVRIGATQSIQTQGSLKRTDGTLDMAIEGDGYFQVLQPDGSTAYTRDGSFKLDGEGNVVNSDGLFLEPQFTIPEDATEVNIREDGTVSVVTQGDTEAQEVGQIEVAKFVNPSGLKDIGSNLKEETTASGAPQVLTPGQDGAGQVRQGVLEKSNVDVVDSMTKLITAQRAFEMNSRSIQTTDGMLQEVSNLTR